MFILDKIKEVLSIEDGKKQETIQINKKTQTIDQNYANGILFMTLSILETLELRASQKLIKGVERNFK